MKKKDGKKRITIDAGIDLGNGMTIPATFRVTEEQNSRIEEIIRLKEEADEEYDLSDVIVEVLDEDEDEEQ